MCRVMATYPLAQMARITATTRNAAGIPVSPVVAYAVGITPAATVSGATPARTKNSTAGPPGPEEDQRGGPAEPVPGQCPRHAARPGPCYLSSGHRGELLILSLGWG